MKPAAPFQGTLVGLARTIYIRCVYGFFCREITKQANFPELTDIQLKNVASSLTYTIIDSAIIVDKKTRRAIKSRFPHF